MRQYCISENYSILEAMAAINSNHSRCVVVLNEKGTVLGVVSQGDIIRALLNNSSFYSPISQIVQSAFIYLHETNVKQACDLFRKCSITLIPIVDDDFKLLDIITISQVFDFLLKEEK